MKKNEKIAAYLLLILTVILSGCNAFSEAAQPITAVTLQINNPQMSVNGETCEIDPGIGTAPIIKDGRTLVPIRAIIESLGGTADWDENLKQVTLKIRSDSVKLTIGSTNAYANDVKSTLDTAPDIINGRTMLPIRYIADSFGFGVKWDPSLQTVTILNGKYFTSVTTDIIPQYSGEPYTVINNNVPAFDPDIITAKSFEYYSDTDILGRCGVCISSIGTDIMPSGERESIGSVKPSGWHSTKYDIVDGKYLYNRCHLIGYQLTAENANENNLITGTRYMNIKGMLPFENMTADYIKETGNHVMYRATPIFTDNNLVADGILLEAYSVEDKGSGISFNVFCYNVQPGVDIDYHTGDSSLAETSVPDSNTLPQGKDIITSPKDSKATTNNSTSSAKYILNTKTMKYHLPDCTSVKKIKEENKQSSSENADRLKKLGYSPCGNCIGNH